MSVDAHNLQAIFAMRALWEKLDPAATPSLATFKPPGVRRNVALLPGSFNPPTAAHMLLAERALQEGFDCVVLLLAHNTVGKQPSGLIPEDRLLAMRALTGGAFGVGASSHGLYADQAEAAQRVYPDAEITFLVGSTIATARSSGCSVRRVSWSPRARIKASYCVQCSSRTAVSPTACLCSGFIPRLAICPRRACAACCVPAPSPRAWSPRPSPNC